MSKFSRMSKFKDLRDEVNKDVVSDSDSITNETVESYSKRLNTIDDKAFEQVNQESTPVDTFDAFFVKPEDKRVNTFDGFDNLLKDLEQDDVKLKVEPTIPVAETVSKDDFFATTPNVTADDDFFATTPNVPADDDFFVTTPSVTADDDFFATKAPQPTEPGVFFTPASTAQPKTEDFFASPAADTQPEMQFDNSVGNTGQVTDIFGEQTVEEPMQAFDFFSSENKEPESLIFDERAFDPFFSEKEEAPAATPAATGEMTDMFNAFFASTAPVSEVVATAEPAPVVAPTVVEVEETAPFMFKFDNELKEETSENEATPIVETFFTSDVVNEVAPAVNKFEADAIDYETLINDIAAENNLTAAEIEEVRMNFEYEKKAASTTPEVEPTEQNHEVVAPVETEKVLEDVKAYNVKEGNRSEEATELNILRKINRELESQNEVADLKVSEDTNEHSLIEDWKEHTQQIELRLNDQAKKIDKHDSRINQANIWITVLIVVIVLLIALFLGLLFLTNQ